MHSLAGNRKFRRLLAGRLVTNAGDSIYYVAALWLVHDITGSTTFTGLRPFCTCYRVSASSSSGRRSTGRPSG